MTTYKNKDLFFIIISTIFLLVISTNITSFWIEKVSAYELDFSQGDKYATISGLILLIGLIIRSINHSKDLSSAVSKNRLISIIIGYCFISCFWSPDVFISLRRFLKVFIIIYLIIFFGYQKVYLKEILRYYIVFSLITSVILIILFPEYGIQNYMGEKLLPRGIFNNKNFLGAFCACSILLIINYKLYKKFSYIFLIVLFVLLLSTNSMTAIVGVSFSLLVLCIHYILSRIKSHLRSVIVYTSVLVVILILSLALYVDFSIDALFKLFNKDPSFTGRDDLWKFFIGYSLKNNFLLGAGFSSFFNGYKTSWIVSKLDWAAESAHSDFIQILLDLGVIGVSFLILFIVSSIVKGIKDIRLFSIILFFTIEAFFEINFLKTTFIFITIMYSFVRYNSNEDADK